MTENKRFKEIVSTQKIVDNNTGKVHDGLIDDELLDTINELSEENEQLKQCLNKAKNDKKQLGIDFMKFKMKLIEQLQIHMIMQVNKGKRI